jgi:hypothetical protein
MRVRDQVRRAAIVTAGAALAAVLGATGPTPSSASSTPPTQITAVHAMPGTPAVTVYQNGGVLIRRLNTGTVAGPITVNPGTYSYAVRPRTAAASSAPLVAISGVRLITGEHASLVAGFTATGQRKIWVSPNPQSAVPSGKARLIVRHVAAAGAIDMYVGSTMKVSGLVNGMQATSIVSAGTKSIKVDLHNSSAAVIGPVNYTLRAGTTTVLYVIGASATTTLGFATQRY